jgi:hypothetical protein
MEPKYLMPFFDRLCCCLPNESLRIMRCKIDPYDPDAEEPELAADQIGVFTVRGVLQVYPKSSS